MRKIRVLLADDHAVVRDGQAAILALDDQFEVVGEAKDGDEAVRLFAELQPDVMVLDLRMPGRDGFAVLTSVRQTDPEARVLVMSTYQGEHDVQHALRLGARGYLIKDCSRGEFAEAVGKVARGHRALPAGVLERVAAGLEQKTLTEREMEVLSLIARGKSNKEIGTILFIAEGTVKSHVQSLLEKLDAADRAQAVVVAARRGYLHI